jgi:hypothetical protein
MKNISHYVSTRYVVAFFEKEKAFWLFGVSLQLLRYVRNVQTAKRNCKFRLALVLFFVFFDKKELGNT